MGLLNKIKSALGMDGSGSTRSGGDVDARVERGPSSGSEDAVKGTSTGGSLDDDELGLDENTSGSSTGSTGSTEDEWFDDDDADDAIEEAESSSTGASSSASTGAGSSSSTGSSSSASTGAGSSSGTGSSGSASTGTSDDDGASGTDASGSESTGTGSLEDVVPDEDGGAGGAPDSGADEDVTEVSGIGPAYGERLEAAGIETVGDLATADAASLSEDTDIAQGRIETWIESAQNF